MEFGERMRFCPSCERIVPRDTMQLTYDCHGIPYRYLCPDCYERAMENEKGYDGEYYDEIDECIEED